MSTKVANFPYICVASKEALERGRIMGSAARELISESIESYAQIFQHYTGLGWEQVRKIACEFAPAVSDYDPEIMSEMEGLAEGADLEVGDILALNARTEIMFGLSVPVPEECTAFYAGPSATADGHVLLGQNWDWLPRSIRSVIVADIDQGGERPAFVMVPEAGLVGKAGFNENGIGVTLNAVVSDIDVGDRHVPSHVILRGILNSRTLEEALAAVVRARRGASANYTIASACGWGLAVETGPGGVESVFLVRPKDDVLGHANHFLSEVPFGDLSITKWPDSVGRQARMTAFLQEQRGSLSMDAIKEILRDEVGLPGSICRHPNPAVDPVEASCTVASLIFDLSDRRAEIAHGLPTTSEYEDFSPAFRTRLMQSNEVGKVTTQ